MLILLSALIAFPLAWLAMSSWLKSFSFRIGISGWYLLLAGGAAVVIAIVTISFEAIRVAIANPVKSLRSE
jgi:putative ABC transport system permease protein